MKKTRRISITRQVRVLVPQKDGKMKEELVHKRFTCLVNAGVTANHKMCENDIQ